MTIILDVEDNCYQEISYGYSSTVLHQFAREVYRWVRSLWRKKPKDRPAVIKEWSDSGKGKYLKISRNSPSAIATYHFMFLGERRKLILFVDDLQLYRRYKRKRAARSTEDVLMEERFNYCFTLLWNHYDALSGRSIIESIGIWGVGFTQDEYNRCPEIIASKLAFSLWSINHHGEGIYLFLKRMDLQVMITNIIKDVIGSNRLILIKRVD